jgi:hypothetical protein
MLTTSERFPKGRKGCWPSQEALRKGGKDADHVRKPSEKAERMLITSGSPPKGRKGCWHRQEDFRKGGKVADQVRKVSEKAERLLTTSGRFLYYLITQPFLLICILQLKLNYYEKILRYYSCFLFWIFLAIPNCKHSWCEF